MSRYQTSAPRVAIGIAATTMTALTFGLLVVLPATKEPTSQGLVPLAAANGVALAPCEAAPSPRCVGAVEVRESEAAAAPVPDARHQCPQPG